MTEVTRGLSVDDFRKKYPGSTEEQVALYAQAVAAEQARGPLPAEPDLPMPRITVQRPPSEIGWGPSAHPSQPAAKGVFSQRFVTPYLDQAPPPSPAPDLTSDIRRIVLGRRLTPAERAAAERPDMSGDDLLALLAGVPNAREWEALEGD